MKSSIVHRYITTERGKKFILLLQDFNIFSSLTSNFFPAKLMYKKTRYALLFLLAVVIPWIALVECAHSLVKLDITQGNVEPLPVAIVPFEGNSQEDNELATNITKIITSDLETSGLFRVISSDAFLEKLTLNTQPNFSNWRKINASIVVTGRVDLLSAEGKVRVQFRSWDPFNETSIQAISYSIHSGSWRRLGHKIADQIYQHLTGEKGYFDSRIAFIAEKGEQKSRIKRLATMDQDGANLKFWTDGRDLVLTPRFDPQIQKITYLSYRNRIPQVFLLNLENGLQKLVGNFQGMSFAPRFSPDGSALIMSIAVNGSTSIYEFNITNGSTRRLTNDMGTISTSPSYSPDSGKIVFNSDRGGSRQIYVMNQDGSDVHRISFGDGTYATPVWSPRGDLIAFTKILRGKFYIGVMRPDGGNERLLTTSWLEEAPTWSPNGRVIMFYRQFLDGESKLYAVDITGYHERLIPTPMSASDPAWSPLLN
ncbi:Tol-Pal system protein TolB [Alphaproteobacteria bacterium]